MFSAARLWVAQGGKCFHCDQPMLMRGHHDTPSPEKHMCWSREHLKPRKKGGGRGTNIVLAHRRCNMERGDRDPTPDQLSRAQAIWAKAITLTETQVFHVQRGMKGIFPTRLYPEESEPKFIP